LAGHKQADMPDEAGGIPVNGISLPRYLLLPVLIAMLLAGVYLSFRAGADYVLQYRVNSTLDRWQQSGKPVDLLQWKQLLADAGAGAKASPHDADLENGVGRLYDFRATAMAESVDQRKRFYALAADHYKQVIALRPAWPYGWMNLTILMAKAGIFDRTFMHALKQTIHLAPWEQSTLPNLVRLSVLAWPYMAAADRSVIGAYLIRAAEQRGGEVRRVLQQNGSIDFFCRVISRNRKGNGGEVSFCDVTMPEKH